MPNTFLAWLPIPSLIQLRLVYLALKLKRTYIRIVFIVLRMVTYQVTPFLAVPLSILHYRKLVTIASY